MQKLAIDFVDDNDFASEGKKAVEKMTKTLKRHKQLHEATTGRVQFDKTYFFSWKCKTENGKFKIENIERDLKVNNTSIIQLKVKEAIRTLGVHICPKL